jgi:hypothetical protein
MTYADAPLFVTLKFVSAEAVRSVPHRAAIANREIAIARTRM